MIPGSHTYNARVLISDAWEPGNETSLVVGNGKQGGESVNSEEVTIHFFVHALILWGIFLYMFKKLLHLRL